MLKSMATKRARRIWAGVEKAAKRCPEWVKPLVEKASAELAERIAKNQAPPN